MDVELDMLDVVSIVMLVRFSLGCSVSQGAAVAAIMRRELDGIAYAIVLVCVR